MSTKYFALLTQLGADKLANAAALGTKIEITHMAVGDGGGSLPTPDTKQTKLINEKRRAAINTLSIDPKNTNQIISEQVIPESEGGWWIREIGLFDKDGILIAVGNCAESYKPQLQEGSGRTQTIRMILIVSSTESVTLKVDPSVVLATREYVDDSIQKHSNSRNHPDATLKEKGFVILSSAVDSNSETHAATPKAVKAAYDFANAANNNANGRVPSGRKVNGKALSEDIRLKASDVDAYNKTETDARVNDAKAQAKAANDNADGRVPTGRKVNGKALNADISLNSGDVGAYSKGETDIRVDGAKEQAKAANENANGRVPAGRKVNGKALNADISLNSADVGAYSKGETDTRVDEAKALANARLEKNQNGADIPNKPKFVENLGLAETKNQAQNALPRSGGEVTGDITISTDSEIAWRKNTDMAAIGFKNTGDGDTDSYMWFKTADNGNEYFKWQHSLSGGGTNEWMSLKSDNLRVKGHQVYHEGYKPTAAIVGAYTKSEAESKYQPKGNYAVRGENYTKQESDGKYQPRGNYQPIGNYILRGDCYTKGESDSRYLSFQNRSPRTVLSGVSLNDGETANLGVDCRGKVMWVWCTEREFPAAMTVIPIDNYGVSTHYGYQGSIDLTLINGGRTIKVIFTRKDTRLWRIDIWD